MLFSLNLVFFAVFSSYLLGNSQRNQEVAAYISVFITFILLLIIIAYHVYTYTTFVPKVLRAKINQMVERFVQTVHKPITEDPGSVHMLGDDTLELIALDMHRNSCTTSELPHPSEDAALTYSVVEIPATPP